MGLLRVDGGEMVEDGPLFLGGSGGGKLGDPVMGGPYSGPLAPDLGARVPVGRPCSPTSILAVKQGYDREDPALGSPMVWRSRRCSRPRVILGSLDCVQWWCGCSSGKADAICAWRSEDHHGPKLEEVTEQERR
jgi:hypothetical protein